MAANNKNENGAYVQCIYCGKVKAFYQWFNNPIIAVCGERNDERQVAATLRSCKLFVRAEESKQPPVQHFDHYQVPGEEDNS